MDVAATQFALEERAAGERPQGQLLAGQPPRPKPQARREVGLRVAGARQVELHVHMAPLVAVGHVHRAAAGDEDTFGSRLNHRRHASLPAGSSLSRACASTSASMAVERRASRSIITV